MPSTNSSQEIRELRNEISILRSLLSRKTGEGSANIKGKIVNPSTISGTSVANNSITNAKLTSDCVKQANLDTEIVTVSVSAGQPSGTATVTSGSIVLGWYPTGNMDQFVDNISITSTTLTLTLAANATATNTFSIILLKS